MAGLIVDVLDEVDDDALAAAGEASAATTVNLSEEALDADAAASFEKEALASPQTWKDWVLDKIKSIELKDVGQVVMIGTGIYMLYQMVSKQAEAASAGGQKVKLSSAIAGAQATLVDNYDTTVQAVAVKTMNDTATFNALPPAAQTAVKEAATMSGDVYWIEVGPTIMETLAETPVYDPTP